MKSLAILSKALATIALLGCAIIVLNVFWQMSEILAWGIRHEWHFRNMLGWGFGWLVHVELHILALLLIAPYWVFVRDSSGLSPLFHSRLINSLVLIGLVLFVFFTVFATYLTSSFP